MQDKFVFLRAKMKITVAVESVYMGSASGFTQVVVDDSEQVQEIINRFCHAKGAAVDPLFAIISDANVNFDSRKRIREYQVQNNDRLKLGRRREPCSMFLFVNWIRLSILGILAGILGLLGIFLVNLLMRETPPKYGVVIDAGSTHTEVILYSWPGQKFRNTGQVKEVAACTIGQSGIAKVAPENVADYMSICLPNITSHVPPEFVSETKIFFGATAGMRVLQERNATLTESIMSQTRKVLSKSGFQYADENAIIISGEKEGLAGWISVNFLKNVLQDNFRHENESSTFGSLDMGGASMQIAVEIKDSNDTNNGIRGPSDHLVTLFDNNYTVYTESFLCYGAEQALNRYRSLLLLVHNFTSGNTVLSPCEPSGSSSKLSLSDVFVPPCAQIPQSLVPTEKMDTVYTFRGTSDVDSCLRAVKELFLPDICKRLESPHCSTSENVPQDATLTHFVNLGWFQAYSSFGHIMNNLNMSVIGSLDEYSSKINRTCQIDYSSLMFAHNTFKIRIPLRKFEELCFTGMYIRTVLTDFFGFSSREDWKRIEFRKEIGAIGLSWPLGLMLNATVYVPMGTTVSEMNESTMIILVVVFGLITILGCMFFYHGFKIRRSTKYEKLSQVV